MTLTIDTEQARGDTPVRSSSPSPTSMRPIRVAIGWVAVIVVLAAALALALVVLRDTRSSAGADRAPATSQQLLPGPYGSADAAERWLTDGSSSTPLEVPRSADAAERWLEPDRSARTAP